MSIDTEFNASGCSRSGRPFGGFDRGCIAGDSERTGAGESQQPGRSDGGGRGAVGPGRFGTGGAQDDTDILREWSNVGGTWRVMVGNVFEENVVSVFDVDEGEL